MKRTLLSFFAVLAFAFGSFAQLWVTQNSNLPASRGITDMVAVDANTVWAAAYDGTAPTNPCVDFTRTLNGGTLWTAGTITAATGTSIANISAIDGTHAWAITYYQSGSGTKDGVYYTSNGGSTWVQQTTAAFSDAASFPDCIWFWNATTGYCMGDPIGSPISFEIYTTTDGGNTWVAVPAANKPAPLTGEFGLVANQSIVGNTVWFSTNMGRVFKSTDKGLHWTVATCTPLSGNYIEPFFKSDMYGLIMDKNPGSTGFLAYTNDGGSTFTARNNTGNTFTFDMAYLPGTTSTWVSTGADVTNNAAGVTYSFDDGVTWNDMTETVGSQFLATAWINNSTGWAGAFSAGPGDGGMYKFNSTLIAPVANFSANNTSINVGAQVTFTNLSTGNPGTFSWVFQGGTPATSNLQNPPPITYNTPGVFDVTLTVTNSWGSDTELKSGYIVVGGTGYVTVISPNGGENWQIGSSHNITWNSPGITNVKIEYTSNNGSSWSTIITNYPASGGSYLWTIPNAPSTQCKVRISDAGNASVSDQSDNVFTISSSNQLVTVISPNGGENWLVGSVNYITWNSSGIANVKIEYTTDNGNSWTTIISTYQASAGSYFWTVPNTPSNQCKERISDSGNPSVNDMSDNVFTISANQSIFVTNPNGGETWQVGSIQNITWTSSGFPNVKIEYSTNGGNSWNTIIYYYPASAGNYSWVIPNTPSNQCKVRISDYGNSNLWDMSDNNFTISAGGQSTPEICIVTVDSISDKNMIVWEKPYSTTIDHYNLYSEGNQANVYNIIGSVPYSSFSTFTDLASNPLQQANRYKISLVDIYNMETTLSDDHMSVHLTINQGAGNTFNLMWNNYEGFSYLSLNIYRGTSPSNISLLATVASSINSFTDLYPPAGYVYYKIEVLKPVPCSPSKTAITSSISNLASNDPYLSSGNIQAPDADVQIFPNPTTGKVKVRSGRIIEKVDIYNSIGIQVQSTLGGSMEMVFDLFNLGKGVYYLRVDTGNKIEVRKVVVM